MQRQADQLRARRDAQLREHLVQVVVHRARAEEQLGGDLPVGSALAHDPHDLQLLWREAAERGLVPPARGLAAGPQLARGKVGPRPRPEPLEHLERGPQMSPRIGAPALAAQPFPVPQLGTGRVERPPATGVLLERVLEVLLRAVARSQQRTAAGYERTGPLRTGVPRPRLEPGQRRSRRLLLLRAYRHL